MNIAGEINISNYGYGTIQVFKWYRVSQVMEQLTFDDLKEKNSVIWTCRSSRLDHKLITFSRPRRIASSMVWKI